MTHGVDSECIGNMLINGYPLKAGHLMTSTTERYDRMALPRSGQVPDVR